MCALDEMLARASAAPRALTAAERTTLIGLEDPDEIRSLHAAAYAIKCRYSGKKVALRGLIEMGNACAKDCFYCGIRKSNAAVGRYQLSVEDVVRLARINCAFNYASLVLQSGEIESEAHTVFIETCLRRIMALEPPPGVTLSLGEQEESVYRRWREAGAVRYLLRIETSNPALYATLHPASHSWTRRVACLHALRRTGYQVGTGVMIGLPGQTVADLAQDVQFFGDMDVDMIGMGPYIPHPDTPLGRGRTITPDWTARQLRLGLNMIAVTRLDLHSVNIAATTALQTLAADGRERGILAGANVMMPNVTDVAFRRRYQLYAGKPNLDENAEVARRDLEASLARLGESIAWGQRGDSPHFFQSDPRARVRFVV